MLDAKDGGRNYRNRRSILHHCYTETTCPSKMTTSKVEFFYHPGFNESIIPINSEIKQKIQRYFKCHTDTKLQKEESRCCFEILPGFNHRIIDRFMIVVLKLLKESTS